MPFMHGFHLVFVTAMHIMLIFFRMISDHMFSFMSIMHFPTFDAVPRRNRNTFSMLLYAVGLSREFRRGLLCGRLFLFLRRLHHAVFLVALHGRRIFIPVFHRSILLFRAIHL